MEDAVAVGQLFGYLICACRGKSRSAVTMYREAAKVLGEETDEW